MPNWRKNSILIIVLVSLALAIILPGCGKTMVKTPDLEGLSVEAAQAELKKADLTTSGKKEEFSDTVPAGSIISFSPPAGKEVEEGTSVSLVVSKGPKPVAIPEIVGGSEADAVAALSAAGLAAEVSREYSDSATEGVIMSMDPPAGTECAPGTQVRVVVSLGPAYVTCSTCSGRGTVVTPVTCYECGGTGLCYT